MQTSAPDHSQLEAVVSSLDPTAPNCRNRIAEVRKQIDEACDECRTLNVQTFS